MAATTRTLPRRRRTYQERQVSRRWRSHMNHISMWSSLTSTSTSTNEWALSQQKSLEQSVMNSIVPLVILQSGSGIEHTYRMYLNHTTYSSDSQLSLPFKVDTSINSRSTDNMTSMINGVIESTTISLNNGMKQYRYSFRRHGVIHPLEAHFTESLSQPYGQSIMGAAASRHHYSRATIMAHLASYTRYGDNDAHNNEMVVDSTDDVYHVLQLIESPLVLLEDDLNRVVHSHVLNNGMLLLTYTNDPTLSSVQELNSLLWSPFSLASLSSTTPSMASSSSSSSLSLSRLSLLDRCGTLIWYDCPISQKITFLSLGTSYLGPSLPLSPHGDWIVTYRQHRSMYPFGLTPLMDHRPNHEILNVLTVSAAAAATSTTTAANGTLKKEEKLGVRSVDHVALSNDGTFLAVLDNIDRIRFYETSPLVITSPISTTSPKWSIRIQRSSLWTFPPSLPPARPTTNSTARTKPEPHLSDQQMIWIGMKHIMLRWLYGARVYDIHSGECIQEYHYVTSIEVYGKSDGSWSCSGRRNGTGGHGDDHNGRYVVSWIDDPRPSPIPNNINDSNNNNGNDNDARERIEKQKAAWLHYNNNGNELRRRVSAWDLSVSTTAPLHEWRFPLISNDAPQGKPRMSRMHTNGGWIGHWVNDQWIVIGRLQSISFTVYHVRTGHPLHLYQMTNPTTSLHSSSSSREQQHHQAAVQHWRVMAVVPVRMALIKPWMHLIAMTLRTAASNSSLNDTIIALVSIIMSYFVN
jgi:hypothetical protein